MKTTSTLKTLSLNNLWSGAGTMAKLFSLSAFMLLTILCSGQEICNNGIDDDGDMLIDINDSDCICTNVAPLTNVYGNPCSTLSLEFEVPGATYFQWYKDGVAIETYNWSSIAITRFNPTGEGTYQVYADTPSGCIASEPYVAERDEYYTHLGDLFICEGDTVYFEGFSFFRESIFRFTTKSQEGCDSVVEFDIKFVEGTCAPNYMSGAIFYDANRNGIKDAGENGINNIGLQVDPDSTIVFPSRTGDFLVLGEEGNDYEISIDLSNEPSGKWIITTDKETYIISDFDRSNLDKYEINFGLALNENYNSGLITQRPYVARCNTTEQLSISFQNQGYPVIGNDYVELTLELDTIFTVLSTYPDPTSVSGNKYTYQFYQLESFDTESIHFEIENPEETLTGAPYKNVTRASLIRNNEEIVLDKKTYNSIIRCSYDPNDKQVSPIGIGDNNETALDQELIYTVRFQNTGNDVAFDVSIIDSLDNNLDLSSFKVLGSSHEMTTKLDRYVVEFLFKDINLPDSTSNERLSHGYVTYSIYPMADVEENTLITNNADIYFDANPPIRTNTTENLLVEKAGISSIIGLESIELELRSLNGKEVQLRWATLYDANNKDFIIERKTGTGNWEALGKVANATSSQADIHYGFVDKNPVEGINYYRIKVLKYQGEIKYSKVKSVNFKHLEAVSIFPNPLTADQQLYITNPSSKVRVVTIVNKLGQQLNKLKIQPGNNTISVSHLDAGIYFCIIEDALEKESYKLVIRK